MAWLQRLVPATACLASLGVVAPEAHAQGVGYLTIEINDLRQGLGGGVGRVSRQFVLRLQGNRVHEVATISGRRGTRQIQTESAFREENVGRRASLLWRVGEGNSLIRRAEHPQHVETVVVKVSGSTCQVSVRNDLKPGYSTYVFLGGGGRGLGGLGGGRRGPRAGIGGYPVGGGGGPGYREFVSIQTESATCRLGG